VFKISFYKINSQEFVFCAGWAGNLFM